MEKIMKIRKRKIISLLLVLLLLVVGAAGCKKDGAVVSDTADGQEEGKKNVAMGRYVEKEIEIPKEENMDTVMDLLKEDDGSIVLFTRHLDKEKAAFYKYTLMEGNTWEKEECVWLNELGLDSKGLIGEITYGEDKSYYMVYRHSMEEETVPRSYVVKSEDGLEAKEVVIPELEETGDFGYTVLPYSIEVLENGNIALQTYQGVLVYNGKTGKKLLESMDSQSAAVSGNTLYVFSEEKKNITVYDGEKGEEERVCPVELEDSYGIKLNISKEKGIRLLSTEGIQLLKEGSDLWETVVDSDLNKMSSPKYYFHSFAEGNQEDYYIYYNSVDEVGKLVQYVYDPNMPVEPETTLTIFSLQDNSAIKQAANDFQSKNPNIRVDFQVAPAEDKTGTSGDYIRTFNTELLAGNGPDLIVLDGLPEQSYIEKGVLLDISDIINPLVTSGDFLPNLIPSYTVEDKIYMVPTRIGIPMAFGTKELTGAAGDLEKIADFILKNPDKSTLGTLDRNAFVKFYLNALNNEIVDENGYFDGALLKPFLEKLKKILDASKVSDGTRENWPSSDWDMIEEGNELYLSVISGFYQAQSGFSVINLIDLDAAAVNKAFVPFGKIGINKAGKNQEIAKQFLQSIFEEEAQNSDYFDGFPVSTKSLDHYLELERKYGKAFGGSFTGADGKSYEMVIDWPNKEQRKSIIAMCKTVNQEANLDSTLEAMVMEEVAGYFDGKKSLEETVDMIVNKTKTYQSE